MQIQQIRYFLALCAERRNARHYLAMHAAGNARQIGRAQRVELGEPEPLAEPVGREQLLLCDDAWAEGGGRKTPAFLQCFWTIADYGERAEGAGFEPARRFITVYTLSRRAPSTARPSLQACLHTGRGCGQPSEAARGVQRSARS